MQGEAGWLVNLGPRVGQTKRDPRLQLTTRKTNIKVSRRYLGQNISVAQLVPGGKLGQFTGPNLDPVGKPVGATYFGDNRANGSVQCAGGVTAERQVARQHRHE